jgi:signal peptidase I
MNRPNTTPLDDEVSVGSQMPKNAPPALPLPSVGELSGSTATPQPVPTQSPEENAIPILAEPGENSQKASFRDRSPLRMTLTIAIIFLSLFLFLRVFAIEPFGVPTGSMAPSLIGNHREGPCPRCGYPVRVGIPSQGGNPAELFSHVGCPNCDKHFSLAEARDLNGDRLLVDKNVFNLRKPRRWEMAVFHCPDPDPKELGKPYVKRIIGLPGESIRLLGGDVYANDVLVRKDLAEVRETRLPVFDMSYIPDPGGWHSRWLVEPPESDPRLPLTSNRQLEEADSSAVHRGELRLDAGDPARPSAGLRYRHWNLDDRKEEPIRAWSSYDGVPRSFNQLPAVHDFSITCEIEVISAVPDAVFECGLYDGVDTILAEISVGPRANGLVVLTQAGKGGLSSVRGVSLEAGKTYRLEFAFVDRRGILALDGKQVLPNADLPQVAHTNEVRQPVQLRTRACNLTIRNFKLYRDIYYTQFGEHGTRHPAVLGPNEFFVLGDNSGNSQDSRKWPKPGVPETDFIGKPFLIHQPLHPGRISIGGREKVFQTLDWSRVRWLH